MAREQFGREGIEIVAVVRFSSSGKRHLDPGGIRRPWAAIFSTFTSLPFAESSRD
jgi:hypothetical protein